MSEPQHHPITLESAAKLLRARGFPAEERILRRACARRELPATKRPNGRRWFVVHTDLYDWAERAFVRNTSCSHSETARQEKARRAFKIRCGELAFFDFQSHKCAF
jgi:hypothetical protein